jgi:3-hydroxyisobutyrate dehydrogenase-like beta-hydroxyacid dehydrogenase
MKGDEGVFKLCEISNVRRGFYTALMQFPRAESETMGSDTLGFIGTGVMGEPMCRNLVLRSGRPVIAFDLAKEPLERLRAAGASVAAAAGEAIAASETVLLCLPDGAKLKALCEGANGIYAAARAGQTFIDLGTSGAGLTREIAGKLAAKGVAWADAPVARTREAAQKGTLSVMVGADPVVYARIEPLLRCVASDITHCGGVGAGQVVKILNNMVLFQTVNALAEALAIGRRAGLDAALLFETLAKGSADSFALRNHGMKAMLPGIYPERAFSTEYALKDLGYALDLARETGLRLRGAEIVDAVLRETAEAGFGGQYFPVLAKIVAKTGSE